MPTHEVDAVLWARLRGMDEGAQRTLVQELVAARATGPAEVIRVLSAVIDATQNSTTTSFKVGGARRDR